jgi:hypothetical protein
MDDESRRAYRAIIASSANEIRNFAFMLLRMNYIPANLDYAATRTNGEKERSAIIARLGAVCLAGLPLCCRAKHTSASGEEITDFRYENLQSWSARLW